MCKGKKAKGWWKYVGRSYSHKGGVRIFVYLWPTVSYQRDRFLDNQEGFVWSLGDPLDYSVGGE